MEEKILVLDFGGQYNQLIARRVREQQATMEEKILVLDFGGQYNQLIARRVREQQVYAEIKPYNQISVSEIKEAGYKGIIFTGGPNSVYDSLSPHYDPAVLNLGIPILGICYGDQLMAFMADGQVSSAQSSSEYGKTALYSKSCTLFQGVPIPILGICYGDQLMAFMADGQVSSAQSSSEYGKTALYSKSCTLFQGVPHTSFCWMSHTDYISQIPSGFRIIAHTDKCPCAAMCDESRKLYGVQFHPEVSHTAYGKQILHNFLFDICQCRGSWNLEDFAQRSISRYQRTLSGKKVLCALSGGVDSAVAAVLLHKAIGDGLTSAAAWTVPLPQFCSTKQSEMV